MPTNSPRETLTPANTTENLTFANVLLTMGGADVGSRMARDNNAASDQKDIAADIPYIAARGSAPVNWRWYQNGFDAEANEPPALAGIPNINYVTHHNGAQYFGYIANNPAENVNMKGETDFFADVANNKLPDGGVIYVRGGYYNIKGFTPPIQNPRYPNPAGLTPDEINMINLAKSGDDDHPGYSDKQISEAMAGRVIAAVAENPTLWSQSAIIITYDETDGQYDHEPPRVLSYGPDGLPLSRGGRIPLILISPYARSGSVSHAEGDHNSVIETINAIFDLPALSSLPEEKAALEAGNAPAFNAFAQAHGPANFEQRYLGPRDTPSAITDNLLSGFSPKRLKGLAPPIPPDFAAIPASRLDSLPHDGGKGCATIGVTPTDANLPNAVPPGFNTLPTTLPAYN